MTYTYDDGFGYITATDDTGNIHEIAFVPNPEEAARVVDLLDKHERLLAAYRPLLAACEKFVEWIRDCQPASTRNVLSDAEAAIRVSKEMQS